MTTYIGYYRQNEDFRRESLAKARESGSAYQDPTFRDKVIGLRDNLPAGLKLIGSYGPLAGTGSYPAIWICETDDPQHLVFVSQWYQGFLDFEWVPANVIGTTRAATTKAMNSNAGLRR